jgi:hypothetical protein
MSDLSFVVALKFFLYYQETKPGEINKYIDSTK